MLQMNLVPKLTQGSPFNSSALDSTCGYSFSSFSSESYGKHVLHLKHRISIIINPFYEAILIAIHESPFWQLLKPRGEQFHPGNRPLTFHPSLDFLLNVCAAAEWKFSIRASVVWRKVWQSSRRLSMKKDSALEYAGNCLPLISHQLVFKNAIQNRRS